MIRFTGKKAALIYAMVVLNGCTRKYVPDEKLAFDPKFREVFTAFTLKDTLRFQGTSGRIKTYVIALDSITENTKGWFINGAPYKLLRLNFQEIGTATPTARRENVVWVNKNPLENNNTIHVGFNNMWHLDTLLQEPNSDTIILNDKKFTNYYSFNSRIAPQPDDDAKYNDDAYTVFVSITKGFFGYKTNSNECWVRIDK
jgi:hypothetical protein